MTAAPRPERDACNPYPCVVGVVGGGSVGGVLGAALVAAGYRVVAVSGASELSRRRIARMLPQAALLAPVEVAGADTDLLLIAVPDDALAAVVAELASALRPGQIVAHTSGAHGLGVLAPMVERGARPLALHPAMTFTGDVGDVARLPGTAFGITAPAELRAFAARLVTDLGGVPEWIAEGDRPLYHAALAHGANHLVTVVNDAADALRAVGVADPATVLGPLLRAALDNALRLGDAALTGPVSRGDASTVAVHLDRLPAEFRAAYRALAGRTVERAVAAGRLGPIDAALVTAVLAAPATGRSDAGRSDVGRPEAGRSDARAGGARQGDARDVDALALEGTTG